MLRNSNVISSLIHHSSNKINNNNNITDINSNSNSKHFISHRHCSRSSNLLVLLQIFMCLLPSMLIKCQV